MSVPYVPTSQLKGLCVASISETEPCRGRANKLICGIGSDIGELPVLATQSTAN
jgi:hypothetical protein